MTQFSYYNHLECPITQATPNDKIIKTGPHIKGDEKSVGNILKKLNINLLTLSNNHLYDFGEKGLKDTLAFCIKNNFETVGVGGNLNEAKLPYRKEINGNKISILNFSENEWSSATEKTGGANPLDIIDNVNQIKQEKSQSDFVFVIIHGGTEYYDLPSPRIKKQYQFYADNGADLIVSHHTHCISGYEKYNNVPIYYGIGNFLFTHDSPFKAWYQGIVLEIEIDENKTLNTKIHFTQQQEKTFELSLIKEEKKQIILDKFQQYCSIIANEELLKQKWEKYIEDNQLLYLKYISPITFINNKYIRALFGKLNLTTKFLNNKGLALYLNLIRCESHFDLTKSSMEKYISKK
jgi:hypothetical protein